MKGCGTVASWRGTRWTMVRTCATACGLDGRAEARWMGMCRAPHPLLSLGLIAVGVPGQPPLSPTNIFAPASTPAQSIFELSLFVWSTAAAIFLVVFSLLAYAVIRFRKKEDDDGREPA